MKLRMTIEVDYADNGVTRNYLKTNLIEWFDKAASEGLLTGPSDAEVNEWDILIEEVDCDDSGHTPGPWKTMWCDNHLEESRYVVDKSNPPMLVADCWPDTPEDFGLPQTWEYQANAKLISAAPDLLEALIKVRDWWTGETLQEEDEMPAEIFFGMLQAINKATGDNA